MSDPTAPQTSTGSGSSGPPEAGKAPGTPGSPTSSEPAPSGRASTGKDPLRRSRTSGIWAAVVALVVLLVLLAVFILQNTQSVQISFFGWDGEAPLAAALLIATATGMLIAVTAGTLRILQLRLRVRRSQKG